MIESPILAIELELLSNSDGYAKPTLVSPVVHLPANHECGGHGVESLLKHSTDYTMSVQLASHGRTVQLKAIPNPSDRVTLKREGGRERRGCIRSWHKIYFSH